MLVSKSTTTTTTTKMSKLLVEYLEEQQEPFALEVYLVERGVHKTNSAKFFGLKKRRDAVANCSSFLHSVLSQIISSNNDMKKTKNYGRTSKNAVHEDKFSSELIRSSTTSTSTMSNCCSLSETDPEDAHCCSKLVIGPHWSINYNNTSLSQKEVVGDEELELREEELVAQENKQLSPVSVLLEETEWNNQGSPIHHYKEGNSKSVGESSSSSSTASIIKRPTQIHNNNKVQKLQELYVGSSDSDDQYIINKRTLRQTKQLLVNCTREVIENHRKRKEKLTNILGVDQLWKLVCENVWLWSQDSIHENNILQLLHSDFLACEQEWSNDSEAEQQKKEVAMELGDAILDNMIDEVITSFLV